MTSMFFQSQRCGPAAMPTESKGRSGKRKAAVDGTTSGLQRVSLVMNGVYSFFYVVSTGMFGPFAKMDRRTYQGASSQVGVKRAHRVPSPNSFVMSDGKLTQKQTASYAPMGWPGGGCAPDQSRKGGQIAR